MDCWSDLICYSSLYLDLFLPFLVLIELSLSSRILFKIVGGALSSLKSPSSILISDLERSSFLPLTEVIERFLFV